jgi:hypothetical protein
MTTKIDKKTLLESSLKNFFEKNKDAGEQLLFLINSDKKKKNGKLSLRKLEFFCNTYARLKNIMYEKDGKKIHLSTEYSQAKYSWGTTSFAAFKRAERYTCEINGQEITTTLGQLNFFRWLFQKDALRIALEKLSDLENEMKIATQKKAEKKEINKKRGKKRKADQICFSS